MTRLIPAGFGLIAVLIAVMVIAIYTGDRERAERDATFLEQCRAAGYNEAKCRFFLTAAGRAGNSEATTQMIIQSAAHS